MTTTKKVELTQKEKIRRFVILGSIVVWVIVVILVILLPRIPGNKVLIKGTNSKPMPSPESPELVEVKGAAFMLSDSFEIRSHTFNEGPYLEKKILVAASPRGVFKFVITSQDLESGLDELPGIRFRRDRPSEYTETAVRLNGTPGVSFIQETDSFEKVVFLKRNSKAYTVAMTSKTAIGKEMADKYFNEALGTISWN